MRLAHPSVRKGWLSALLFLLLYPALLFIWLKVKPYYGFVISRAGAHLAAEFKGARVVRVEDGAERNKVWIREKGYISPYGPGELEISPAFPISNYSFNVPLTWALALALFPVIRWRKRALLEIALVLAGVHLLYVFSFSGLQLYYAEVKVGFRPRALLPQLFWETLWAFTDNMVIRFEPFLVAFYLYLRSK